MCEHSLRAERYPRSGVSRDTLKNFWYTFWNSCNNQNCWIIFPWIYICKFSQINGFHFLWMRSTKDLTMDRSLLWTEVYYAGGCLLPCSININYLHADMSWLLHSNPALPYKCGCFFWYTRICGNLGATHFTSVFNVYNIDYIFVWQCRCFFFLSAWNTFFGICWWLSFSV